MDKSSLVKTVLYSDVLSEEDSAYLIYDLDKVEKHFSELKAAFPLNTLHGIAIKACPLPYMLKLQAAHDLGAEAASIEEVQIALKSGVSPDKIIFDGPAKTKAEIQFCIDNNIYINIDNFDELKRVDQLIHIKNKNFKAGLRLNPQIGAGKIGDTSVAGKVSKFGVNIENEGQIRNAFKQYKWLVGVHVHIGSQGMSLDELVAGTKKIYEFASTLEGLERFDLGGGLPVVYKDEDPDVDFATYTQELKKAVPQLFDGTLQLLTEFGRRIYADTALAVSQIEYVKDDKQIVAHLGADMFLRRVYKPQDWYHRVSVLDAKADSIENAKQDYTIAGPLCFGGDFLSRKVSLPKVKEYDLLVIHDVGAYTLSMWSRHCSRFTPKVIGVKGEKIEVIKKRETIEKLMEFWS